MRTTAKVGRAGTASRRPSSTLQVGLIGLGAVGRSLAASIAAGAAGRTTLSAVLVRDVARAQGAIPTALPVRVFGDTAAFLRTEMDLVVEAAGQEALRAYAAAVLRAGKDLMPISTGAFADASFFEGIVALAAALGRRVLVPSGSIGGLDAISAAALGGLTHAAHTIRKPPRAFAPERLDPAIDGAQSLFEGSVEVGAALFPENANAATAVGLAGAGTRSTLLRIVADPGVTRNVQEIEVVGAFGRLRLAIENVPSENPKTARLVALSVAKALRNLTAPVVIGL